MTALAEGHLQNRAYSAHWVCLSGDLNPALALSLTGWEMLTHYTGK